MLELIGWLTLAWGVFALASALYLMVTDVLDD